MSGRGDRQTTGHAHASHGGEARTSSSPSAKGRAPTALPPSVRAVTDGATIAFADAAPERRTVAHELAHVEQYKRAALIGAPPPQRMFSGRHDPAEQEAARVADVVARGGTAGPIVESPAALLSFEDPPPASQPAPVGPVKTGTFHLDPGLCSVSVPAGMKVAIKVTPPGRADGKSQPIDVEILREVHSAQRIQAFVTSKAEVYDKPPTASKVRTPEELAQLTFGPGQPAFTASGPISITKVDGDNIFTADANAETKAAAAVVVAMTDAGPILIDAGKQFDDASFCDAVGYEVARQVVGATGGKAITEAISTPVGAGGSVLPWVASSIGIGIVRATPDQYDDGTVSQILQQQASYRAWYEKELRAKIEKDRATWEATQPIAPNAGVRDKLWAAHLETAVAEGMKGVAPATRTAHADFDGKTLTNPSNDEVSGPAPDAVAPGEVPDLSAVEWVPDDKVNQLYIYGGGRLTIFSAQGLVLKPKTATLAPQVSAPAPSTLSPTGPVGMGAAAARPVTPWMMMPAVGKAGMLAVRVGGGHAILFDGGGPRILTTAALARASVELGGASVSKVFQSHAHGDHSVANVVRALNLNADQVFIAESAVKAGALGELATTTDPDLVKRGFGKGHKMGLAVKKKAGDPIFETEVEAGNEKIKLFTRVKANEDLDAAKKPTAEQVDNASHLYVVGNESSPNKMLSLGDLRGDEIGRLYAELGEARFKAMMKGVRVINGVGHHFSTSAGQSSADVAGLLKLLEATHGQNGELTIVVQSNQKFAFGGTKTGTAPTGADGALLKFFQRQGVRVVFAGSGPSTSSPTKAASGLSGAVVDSSGNVSTFGTAVQVFDGDPRVVAVNKRLSLLREAQRMLAESAQHAPTALGQEGKSAAELTTAIEADIKRLETLSGELRALAGKDLIDARAPLPADAGPRAKANRAGMHPSGRTEAQILADLETEGPAEKALTPDVRQRLASAVASGRSLALEVEFAHTPTEMTKLIDSLPPERRSALAERYKELRDMVAKIENNTLSPADQLVALSKAQALHAELVAARTSVTGDGLKVIDAEIARVDSAVTQLKSSTTVNETITRDNLGRIARTQWINATNQKVVKGFHNVGRVLGAMMVVHSIEELTGDNPNRTATGSGNNLEAGLRFAHSAYGVDIGLRMASTSFRQAMAGTGAKVGKWEFVLHAVIEVAAVGAADYETTEARDAALVGAGIRAAVNLACMVIGEKMITFFAAAPTHPLIKAGGMGLGLVVMSGGPQILSFLKLDDNVERWTSFAPGEVTEVNQKIGESLNAYRLAIGARQLQQRTDEDLKAMGMNDPAVARQTASSVGSDAAADARAKETELTGLFEAAYKRAQGSYVGLEVLDAQAAEFTRLRAIANKGTDDPNRKDLDERWRAMDKALSLADASEDTIRGMEQWAKLDAKFTELEGKLAKPEPVYKEIHESMGELQLMLDNARYRIDSPTRKRMVNGKELPPARPSALLPATGVARGVYVELLQERERRMARLNNKLLEASNVEPQDAQKDDKPDVGTSLNRLKAIRKSYDTKVKNTAALYPELSDPAIWSDQVKLSGAVENAHRMGLMDFDSLRLLETTMMSASRQLELSLVTASPPPDEVLKKLVDEEVSGARKAIEARQQMKGLILPHELDAVLEQRGAMKDKLEAARIDAAFPARGGDKPKTPLTDEELEVLGSKKMREKAGSGGVASTERALARIRVQERALRAHPADNGHLDYDRDRRRVDRVYVTFRSSTYKIYDDKSRVAKEGVLKNTGLPLFTMGELKMLQIPQLQKLYPANEVAVVAFGGGSIWADLRDLFGVSQQMIDEQIAINAKNKPTNEPAEPPPPPNPAPSGGTP